MKFVRFGLSYPKLPAFLYPRSRGRSDVKYDARDGGEGILVGKFVMEITTSSVFLSFCPFSSKCHLSIDYAISFLSVGPLASL